MMCCGFWRILVQKAVLFGLKGSSIDTAEKILELDCLGLPPGLASGCDPETDTFPKDKYSTNSKEP